MKKTPPPNNISKVFSENPENALKIMLQSITDVSIVMLDLDGTVLTWNEGLKLQTGFDKDIIGASFDSFFSPEDIEISLPQELLETTLRNGKVETSGWRKKKDGTLFFSNEFINTICDAENKILGFTRISRDITHIRENSNLLQKEHDLSEKKNHAILETVIDGIITINESGIIDSINPAVTNLFGYKEEELIGKNISILMPTPYVEDHDSYLKNYLSTNIKKVIGIGREVTGRRKDGSTFPLELSVTEMQIEGKTYFTGVVSDISIRKEYDEKLSYAKQAAESANSAKSQFLANMSHELRTPLNAIIGYSEILSEEIEIIDIEETRSDLEKITKAGKHLLSLINDILDLSKIEAGKVELVTEPVNIIELLDEIVSMAFPLAEKNNNKLVVNNTSNYKSIISDSTRLRQIIFNLISNAGKFTENGKISINVKNINTNTQQHELFFSVSDTGIGMTEAQIDRIFSPFMQAETTTSSKYGGTGLGLTISTKLVEMLGGQLKVKSSPGKGSEFYFSIPLDIKTSEDENNESSIDYYTNTNTVLVIDDDPEAQQIIAKHISKLDFDIEASLDAKSGIEAAKKLKPKIIILDVLLEGIDGWTVLEILKADAATSHIPVITCTIDDNRKKGLALGASEYLVKPITRTSLLSAIKRFT